MEDFKPSQASNVQSDNDNEPDLSMRRTENGAVSSKGHTESPSYEEVPSPTSSEANGGSGMDSQESYRRRKARIEAERANGGDAKKEWLTSRRNQYGGKELQGSEEEGYSSDYSNSTSCDVELEHMLSDGSQSDDEESGLTKVEESRRKKRRRRATDLDARIAGGSSTIMTGQRIADRNVLKKLFMNSLLVASWYLFSLSISIYNKWMFSPKYLDFHFPLFTTCLHMSVQFSLALLVLSAVPRLRPRAESSAGTHKQPRSMREVLFSDKPTMTRMFYLTRIGPCGAATGLDIGLGNMSLKFITLTFYTMCKSSSLAFVLTFAFIFRLESPSIKLVTIIVTMTIGVIMMVAGEVEFDTLGFILVILAALFSGFRWSLTQILLLRSPATSNPFSSILFLAPVMFLSLAIIAIPVEGVAQLAQGLKKLMAVKGAVLGTGILLFPGLLAFLMTASEFALLQRTSVVTLSICGIFKEVVTISAAGIVFHDPLTPINISGLVITIASIVAYNYLKITMMRSEAMVEVEKWQEVPDLATNEYNPTDTEPMLISRDPMQGRTPSNRASHDRSRTSSRTVASKTTREND